MLCGRYSSVLQLGRCLDPISALKADTYVVCGICILTPHVAALGSLARVHSCTLYLTGTRRGLCSRGAGHKVVFGLAPYVVYTIHPERQ